MYCSITKSILILLFDLKIDHQTNVIWHIYLALKAVLVRENPH